MKIVRSLYELRRWVRRMKRERRTIGFVPTLGALHEGHLSLIRRAKKETDRTVVSVFVNPIQFNRKSDFRSYPRPFSQDARLCSRAGADLFFVPSAKAMYPTGHQTLVEVTQLSRNWEGRFRPGHFRGVATVVTKLFNLVRPDAAYFGQKDAQQARLVKQLVQDLDFDIRLKVLPTVREPSGLAMSSRNRRLSSEERRKAPVLFEALQEGGRLIQCGFRRENDVLRRIKQVIRKVPGVRIEYAAIVNPDNFERARRIRGPVLLLLAAWVGKVRLIDCCWARKS